MKRLGNFGSLLLLLSATCAGGSAGNWKSTYNELDSELPLRDFEYCLFVDDYQDKQTLKKCGDVYRVLVSAENEFFPVYIKCQVEGSDPFSSPTVEQAANAVEVAARVLEAVRAENPDVFG